ncbi:hypothetical protein ASG52_07920 [Methylobacterium sp. Leaf456]|uniref:hypothetical protein n=1 Tax=Methylobacterium sp. Leaf456 TaxID=1736382 RepID=UPI0006F7C828|nr:hypothetical protein [Methylobacterium sp. Leaf456]KQT49996.1 hypothetical protein ASG52_07920 [Methylobacterium sp. Leaf456]
MNVESWITVEETPALAQAAREAIDARLALLSDTDRDAFWASIRKAYNTPYNDPVKKPAAPQPIEPAPVVELVLPEIELPVAAIASAALAAEIRAA